MPPKIFAHRGLTRLAPENSREAIEHAIKQGIPGIEIDLRQASDGKLFCFHDDKLDRLTDKSGKSSEMTSLKLQQLRIQPEKSLGTPTQPGHFLFFEELLDLCRGKLTLNIELKGPHWSKSLIREKILQPLETRQMTDEVIISCFYHLPLLAVQKAAPQLRLGLLIHPTQYRVGRPGWTGRWLKLYSIHPPMNLVNRSRIAFWKTAGYAVLVWTVNDMKTYKKLAKWGVSGIISDKPEELLKAR